MADEHPPNVDFLGDLTGDPNATALTAAARRGFIDQLLRPAADDGANITDDPDPNLDEE